jgi:hypothetical protein
MLMLQFVNFRCDRFLIFDKYALGEEPGKQEKAFAITCQRHPLANYVSHFLIISDLFK